MSQSQILTNYKELLTAVKTRIQQSQSKAALAAYKEMILLYWDIGYMITRRQQIEGWGSAVIPRLVKDIRNELPEIKGFSERNIGRMIAFCREYPDLNLILPQAVAKLSAKNSIKNKSKSVEQIQGQDIQCTIQQFVVKIPWGHNILLMEKVKKLPARLWYIENIIENGWSRDDLESMIKTKLYERQGNAVTNFKKNLSDNQSKKAVQLLKDPYLFDFLTLEEPFHERELETGLVKHLEKFLIELGAGFSFVGRQYHIDVCDNDYYLDLLFYHLKLRCFVVVDLKKGDFKPEYAGKMNFYCSVVDDKLKHKTDNPTIGLILCQKKDRVLAEYSLRDINKPIGVSDYELTRSLPDKLKSSLPTVEEIEQELAGLKEDKNE